MPDDQLPPSERYYCWKAHADIEGHGLDGAPRFEKRLLTPHADPNEYEEPFDYMFDTAEEAMEFIEGFEDDADEDGDCGEINIEEAKGWVLCLETLTPVPLPRPWKKRGSP